MRRKDVEHSSGLVIPRCWSILVISEIQAMTGKAEPTGPGWPEIVVGLVCLSVLAIGGAFGLVRLGIDPVPLGLILTALSGVGVRRTTWR